MVWLCMNVVSAPWSHSGSKGLDTMMWSSMDSTWRDSNSLLHMSLLTCSETGKTRLRWKERRWIDRQMGRSVYELKSVYYWYSLKSPVCLATEPPSQACLNPWLHMLQLWTEKHPSIFYFFWLLIFFFTVLRIEHCENVWMRSVEGYYTYDTQYMWECVSVTFLLPSYMDHRTCGETWSAPKALKISLPSNWRRSGPDSRIKVISFWCWGQV